MIGFLSVVIFTAIGIILLTFVIDLLLFLSFLYVIIRLVWELIHDPKLSRFKKNVRNNVNSSK